MLKVEQVAKWQGKSCSTQSHESNNLCKSLTEHDENQNESELDKT